MSDGNKIKAAFDHIHAEEALKQRTMAVLAEKTQRSTARRPFRRRRLAAVLACLLLVLLGAGGGGLYFTPVAAVSVDVNPSLELAVNRFDRVVKVTGRNDDGVALAQSVNLKHLSYPAALETLLASDAMQPYLDDDGLVSVTVIGRDDASGEAMLAAVAACDHGRAQTVECAQGRPEQVTAAHEAGLSFGKYRVFLELQALDATVTAEEAQTMTMYQLRQRIEALSGQETTSPGNCSGSGTGAGNGTSNGSGNGSSSGSGSGNDSDSGGGHGSGHGQQHRNGQ